LIHSSVDPLSARLINIARAIRVLTLTQWCELDTASGIGKLLLQPAKQNQKSKKDARRVKHFKGKGK
jgi:hypothetical protein